MNMHALCSAFRGVRAGGVLSHTQTHRGGDCEREKERDGEVELEVVRGTNREIEREDGGGKEGAGREEEGEWLRLLICIRKTKGVGRAVCPSLRVTKDQGSQSKVFSLDFFLSWSACGRRSSHPRRVITAT